MKRSLFIISTVVAGIAFALLVAVANGWEFRPDLGSLLVLQLASLLGGVCGGIVQSFLECRDEA